MSAREAFLQLSSVSGKFSQLDKNISNKWIGEVWRNEKSYTQKHRTIVVFLELLDSYTEIHDGNSNI